tara:strand:+ start:297 stop:833 length:537 start_codon:yes stop_codon:yes gene_type:complete
MTLTVVPGFEVVRYDPPQNLLDVKKNIFSSLKYFTFWVLIIDFLYLTSQIQNIELFLIFSHVLIIIICAYIFYLKTKEFKTSIYSADVILKGKVLILFDFLFHYLPLILVLNHMWKNSKSVVVNEKSILMILIIMLGYYLTFDTYKIYTLSKQEGIPIFVIYTVIFVILFYGKQCIFI